MIERQVIVTWYTPEEKLPLEDEYVFCTISGRAKNITFNNAVALMCYCKDEGWYSLEHDFDELEVLAWCDLQPYGGDKHGMDKRRG